MGVRCVIVSIIPVLVRKVQAFFLIQIKSNSWMLHGVVNCLIDPRASMMPVEIFTLMLYETSVKKAGTVRRSMLCRLYASTIWTNSVHFAECKSQDCLQRVCIADWLV